MINLQLNMNHTVLAYDALSGVVLCYLPDNSCTPFATWKVSSDGACYWGDYLFDLDSAKNNFDIRAGKIQPGKKPYYYLIGWHKENGMAEIIFGDTVRAVVNEEKRYTADGREYQYLTIVKTGDEGSDHKALLAEILEIQCKADARKAFLSIVSKFKF